MFGLTVDWNPFFAFREVHRAKTDFIVERYAVGPVVL